MLLIGGLLLLVIQTGDKTLLQTLVELLLKMIVPQPAAAGQFGAGILDWIKGLFGNNNLILIVGAVVMMVMMGGKGCTPAPAKADLPPPALETRSDVGAVKFCVLEKETQPTWEAVPRPVLWHWDAVPVVDVGDAEPSPAIAAEPVEAVAAAACVANTCSRQATVRYARPAQGPAYVRGQPLRNGVRWFARVKPVRRALGVVFCLRTCR
jgi:hypothetical protein